MHGVAMSALCLCVLVLPFLPLAAGVGGIPSVSAPTGIARFSTVGPHGTFVPPPSTFTRQLSRLPSGPLGVGPNSTFQTSDWRAGVAVEERINIRRKLREAYFKHCPTYEQLLDTVTAVDEELLFSCSNNRIDYFKSSIDWDSRIQLKRQQLKSTSFANGSAAAAAASSSSSSSASPQGVGNKKRSLDDSNSNSVSLLEVGINNSDLLPLHAAAASSSLDMPPVSQLLASSSLLVASPSSSPPFPKSPSKDTASSLVALGASSSSSSSQPASKKQRN